MVNDYKKSSADNDFMIEGKNACLEAVKSGRHLEKLIVLDGNHDKTIAAIIKEAKKNPGFRLEYADRRHMDRVSGSGKHQGVIAYMAAYNYASVDDILEKAAKKNEPPFIIVLDGIEDPHNLGAIIRTANLSGVHGVIIRQDRAAGLTAAAAKSSAGAINYTPVARVKNIARTIDSLKEKGLWFVCADMGGELMYKLDLKGAIGLVIGNEGSGISDLVRKKCDITAAIPMAGDIDSLNASVAAGVLAYEIVRQRNYS